MNIVEKRNKRFKLNPTSLIVKGVNRSIICDLERTQYHLIPAVLSTILQDKEVDTIQAIIDKYAKSDMAIQSIIENYFLFLIANDLILFSDFIDNYQNVSLAWDFPSKITNAIIDFGINNFDYMKDICSQLATLDCRFIQLRFFDKIDSNQLDKVVSIFEDSIIESIDISIEFDSKLFNNIENFLVKYPRINCIIVYDYPYHTSYNPINKNGRGKLFTYPSKVVEMSCGLVETHNFNTNIRLFTESQHHNTCLNRKISIDKDGYIKNCPSMKHHFGHISETKLEDVIKNPEFTKYWNIKKDEITKCKDCEFRHICTDCRAYIENPDDLYSAPLKCGYNPYTCEWEEWSTNPLKHKAMEYYGFPVS